MIAETAFYTTTAVTDRYHTATKNNIVQRVLITPKLDDCTNVPVVSVGVGYHAPGSDRRYYLPVLNNLIYTTYIPD